MKRLFIAAFILASLSPAHSQNASAPDAQELTRLLKEFLVGAGRNDATVHERFWADDLIYTGSSGRRIGKADILRDVRAAATTPPKPDEPATTYSAEDIRIQQYDTTAIVAFRLVAASEKDGKKEIKNYLNTGIFLKRGGNWQAVSWQATALPDPKAENAPLDQIAKHYVQLVLAIGQHDPDYVDAFYGPPEWKAAAEKEKKSLDAIGNEAAQLSADLKNVPAPPDELGRLRREYLAKQLSALQARVRILKGERLKFDDESRALYDAVAPTFPETHFQQILNQLEAKIPGKGPLPKRYETWREPFIVPNDRLENVFRLAIAECRDRTRAHIKLPENESFAVQYVMDRPWGGYNWYKGDYRSIIEVNTDLPVYIDRAIDLAAHEGYPGHHVYNSLLEKNLVHDRGWVEFTVYALFSPQSLIAEGTANFGREVVFTKPERMKFEKEVLFPAAGIDPARAEEYYAVQDLVKQLDYAGNEAARRLVNGEIDDAAAVTWLGKYGLMEERRAEQRVKFIKRYRSYVINYNFGEDLVRSYIEKRGGTESDPEKRWSEFEKLLASPRLPSALR